MTDPVEVRHHMPERIQKRLTILVVLVDRLAAVATGRHIIERSGEFETDWSCRAQHPTSYFFDAMSVDPTLSMAVML